MKNKNSSIATETMVWIVAGLLLLVALLIYFFPTLSKSFAEKIKIIRSWP